MPTKKTLYMETTEIPAEKTAGEILSALVAVGATQVATDYEAGKIKGLRWTMLVPGQGERLFAMPARIEPVYKILAARNEYASPAQKEQLQAKARRVAWRQLLRWVQAQLAMIDCGMTEASEVFFPYIQTPSGQTLFDAFKVGQLRALLPPEVQ